MKTYRVLVTGVGAIIGYGIINCLKKSKYDVAIIGTDIYEDAVGSKWCDYFEQGVLANDPEYPNFLNNIIIRHNIDLVIPGIEQDILSIAEYFEFFKDSNAKFALNKVALIDLFHDKWKTYQFLQKYKINMIKTHIEGNYEDIIKEIGTPYLLKPRRSYASKGIQQLTDDEEFHYWKKKLGNNFMVQEIVGDNEHEYTIGVFALGDGTYSDIIILNRKLSVDGSTSKAKVFFDPILEDYIKDICQITKPIGPTNFQVIKHDNRYLLLEVNPRISSSTSIREAFGYNEAEMCIEFYLENKIPTKRELNRGSALRYIKDYIIYDSNIS